MTRLNYVAYNGKVIFVKRNGKERKSIPCLIIVILTCWKEVVLVLKEQLGRELHQRSVTYCQKTTWSHDRFSEKLIPVSRIKK